MIAKESSFFMESQDAAATFMLKFWPWIETNKNKLITWTTIVVVIILGIFVFFLASRTKSGLCGRCRNAESDSPSAQFHSGRNFPKLSGRRQ